jgi:hypothetical protein
LSNSLLCRIGKQLLPHLVVAQVVARYGWEYTRIENTGLFDTTEVLALRALTRLDDRGVVRDKGRRNYVKLHPYEDEYATPCLLLQTSARMWMVSCKTF